VSESKASRVVLPVFFGQTDASLTSKRGFEMMCELDPQVAKDLTVLVTSPPMVVTFYVFRGDFPRARRTKLISVVAGLRTTVAGRQLATLFQFEEVTVQSAEGLAPALAILDAAERGSGRTGARSQPE
jgi:phosphonate transport system substrate-binding protein